MGEHEHAFIDSLNSSAVNQLIDAFNVQCLMLRHMRAAMKDSKMGYTVPPAFRERWTTAAQTAHSLALILDRWQAKHSGTGETCEACLNIIIDRYKTKG